MVVLQKVQLLQGVKI